MIALQSLILSTFSIVEFIWKNKVCGVSLLFMIKPENTIYDQNQFFTANPVMVMPKAVSNDLAPRRSLNLEAYKKKRGLI